MQTAHTVRGIRETVRAHGVVEQMLDYGFATLPSNMPAQFPPIARDFGRLARDEREQEYWRVTEAREINPREDPEVDIGILWKRERQKKWTVSALERAEGRTHYDKKTTLHFAPRLLAYLSESGAARDEYEEMLKGLGEAHSFGEHLSLVLAEEFERFLPEHSFVRRVIEAGFWSKTRIVRYNEFDGNANFHRDRCFLTVHIQSSRPGLYLQGRNGEIVRANETNPAQVTVFPGFKFDVVTGGRYDGTIHGVAERGIDLLTEARQTLVYFCQCSVSNREWRDASRRLAEEPRYRISQEACFAEAIRT